MRKLKLHYHGHVVAEDEMLVPQVLARTKNAHFLPGKVWLYGHAIFQLAALICTAVALGIAVHTIGRADGVDPSGNKQVMRLTPSTRR